MVIVKVKDNQQNLVDEFHLNEGIHSVGRLPENTISLRDPKTSREHAEFIVKDGICSIKDKGSTAGILLNDKIVDGTEKLKDGDVISIGDMTLEVYFGEKEEAFLSETVGRLQVIAPAKSDIFLDKVKMTMGRAMECDIQILDSGASQKHAQICLKDGVYILEDLGSRNKTYVNNEIVEKHTLQKGDVIKIGTFEGKFSICERSDLDVLQRTSEMPLPNTESKNSSPKITIFLVALLVLGVIGYAVFMQPETPGTISDAKPLTVLVTQLEKKEVKRSFTSKVEIETAKKVIISTERKNKVGKIFTSNGKVVKKGQKLLILEDKNPELETTKKKLVNIQKELKNARELKPILQQNEILKKQHASKLFKAYQKKKVSISKKKVKNAIKKFREAEKNYKQIVKKLKSLSQKKDSLVRKISSLEKLAEGATIRAPLDGVIVEVLAKEGKMVSNPVLKILDKKTLYTSVLLPRESKIRIGQKVNLKGLANKARIVEATKTPKNKKIKIEINNKTNSDKNTLEVGQSIEVTFDVQQKIPIVAKEAIFTQKNLHFLFVVKEKDGKSQVWQQQIKIEKEKEGFCQLSPSILEKVDWNFWLVKQNLDKLSNGAKVIVKRP